MVTDPRRGEGLAVRVRVRPGASRTRVGGAYGAGPDRALVVAVTARAVDGAATAAVLGAVAQAFGLRPAQVRLRSGATHRTKVVVLDVPDEGEARRRLRQLLQG